MEAARPSTAGRDVAIGCLTTMAGFFSGGMIAVLVAKVVGILTRCTPARGLPACDWHLYMLAGAALGAVSLPILTLRRLRRSDAESRHPERG